MAAWSLGSVAQGCSRWERMKSTSQRLKTGIIFNGTNSNRNIDRNPLTTHTLQIIQYPPSSHGLKAGSPALHRPHYLLCGINTFQCDESMYTMVF
jgi:hypothetical protein